MEDSLNYKTGGLRVYKIVSSDSAGGTISRSFDYGWGGDSSMYSSGVPGGYPIHLIHDNPFCIGQNRTILSNSGMPLTSDGQLTHYMFVTEYYDSLKSSFKNMYMYLADLSAATSFGQSVIVPPTMQTWRNGILLKKTSYEKASSGYRPLLTEEYSYDGLESATIISGLTQSGAFQPYYIDYEWFLPTGNSTTIYSYEETPALSISNGKTLYYNANHQVGKVIITNSKGDSIITRVWYPGDFTGVSGFNISGLLSKYLLDLPVKQEVSVNGKIRSGNIIKYNTLSQPIELYQYENNVLADTIVQSTSSMATTHYQLKTTIGYDYMDNVTQVQAWNSPNVNYIWGWGYSSPFGETINLLPAAEIQNADSNSVAYTSFETTSQGNWTYSSFTSTDSTSPTGERCHYITGDTIRKAGLNTGKVYIVSFWQKSGSSTNVAGSISSKTGKTIDGWTYYEHEVGGISQAVITGSGYIDELRLFPKGALMTSFTYKNGVGLNSQCDVNNRINYYEYDGLGRLRRIKDQDKNIVKVFEYQYQQNSSNY